MTYHPEPHERMPLTGNAGTQITVSSRRRKRCESMAVSSLCVMKVTFQSSYLNYLLPMMPLGLASGLSHWSSTVTLITNCLAIIPLAAILSFATEELSSGFGGTSGGLIKATFGNAIELIVGIVALQKNQLKVVQSSMLGSILSNLLFVTGLCFFSDGLRHRGSNGNGMEQIFSPAIVQAACSLMMIATVSFVLPSILCSSLAKSTTAGWEESILLLSRGTAFILLLIYILYLTFQLYTHSSLFEHEGKSSDLEANGVFEVNAACDTDEDNGQRLDCLAAVCVLIITTILVFVCANSLIYVIDDFANRTRISKTFVAFILIPIAANVAENASAVAVSMRNKMHLAIKRAMGSCVQISLFMIPLLVIVGWIMGRDLMLRFDPLQLMVLYVSVLVANYTMQDGRSNHLEGALLLRLYLIVGVTIWFVPWI